MFAYISYDIQAKKVLKVSWEIAPASKKEINSWGGRKVIVETPDNKLRAGTSMRKQQKLKQQKLKQQKLKQQKLKQQKLKR